MNIDDASTFALVIPTFEGTRFLKRVLGYLRYVDFQGAIVLSDNSSGEHRSFVEQCPKEFSDLNIALHTYPHDVAFLDKMADTLTQVTSQFVMLHAHDDFIIPENAETCVSYLRENPGYSACRGRIAGFSLTRGDKPDALSIGIGGHPMRAYEQDDARERVLDHLKRFASTFYSVHRRELLIEALRETAAATRNVIFFQYLSSCITALQGKIACLDELFYLRQTHDDSWSRSLLRDYEHWPMLITSPNFSGYYQQFRSALVGLVHSTTGASAAELGRDIDVSALKLFERSYCGKEQENPGEAAFLQRLHTGGSIENNALRAVAQFTMQYPDTF